MKKTKRSYHHGDLRNALLEAAAEVLLETGVATLSLREVARRAGVSHGAPAHHFGDKAGLLTALAVEGFVLFRRALEAARDGAAGDPVRSHGATGRAYVRFAVDHPGHFEVMFRKDAIHYDDPELVAAGQAAYDVLRDGIRALYAGQLSEAQVEVQALRAWSMAHGFAKLWLSGALQYGAEPEADLERLLESMFDDLCVPIPMPPGTE